MYPWQPKHVLRHESNKIDFLISQRYFIFYSRPFWYQLTYNLAIHYDDCFQYSRRRFSSVVGLAMVVLASMELPKLLSMLSRRMDPVGLDLALCISWPNRGWNPGAPSFRMLKLRCRMCRLWAMTMIVVKSRKLRQVFLIISIWKLEMNWWRKRESPWLFILVL